MMMATVGSTCGNISDTYIDNDKDNVFSTTT